jgi:outer membrane protein assembly factor BamD
MVQERIQQGPGTVAVAGMHHQARGLVDHDHVLVLVRHRDADRLGQVVVARRSRRERHLDRLPALHLHGARGFPAVDPHVARGDRAREAAARLPGHQGRERAVQAQAGQLERNHEFRHGIIPGMNRSVIAMFLAIALSGCGLFASKTDNKKDWGPADYYGAAKAEFDNRNWEAAIKAYEQLEAKFPYGRFAQQAQLEVAYAYFKQGESAQAISAIDKFSKTHPNHENLDYALYLRALVNFKEDLGPLSRIAFQDLADRDPKSARESFEGFKELTTRFPDSRYADDARERMAYLIEALARHELNVARYYLYRGAYLAAANRAQDAITRFPRSPDHRQSLEVMIEAYDRMGMTALRDDARKVLAKNFPADKMAKEGANRTKPWYQFWE